MSSKSSAKRSRPDFSLEKKAGGLVCGLDEVGRAPLAGPVVAACVYIPEENRRKHIWRKVNDSKLLPRKDREALFEDIKAHSLYAVAESSAREIESLNIVHASFLAMTRAYEEVASGLETVEIEIALIDGHIAMPLPCHTEAIIKGDSKSVSIAAASILAKVTRDRLMTGLAREHPHYGWESNAGYPTKDHLEGIRQHGITDHHRKTFASVRDFIECGHIKRQLSFSV